MDDVPTIEEWVAPIAEMRLGHVLVNYSGRLYCTCGFLSPHEMPELAEHEKLIHEHAVEHRLLREDLDK